MHLYGHCFSFLTLLLGTLAQTSLQSAAAQLPQCALSCLITSITNSSCAVTNHTCICTNDPLQEAVTTCITTSCTLKEALVTKNFTTTACGVPVRDKRALYNAVSSTFGTISGVVVILRFWSKFITNSNQSNLWFDDFFVVATLFTGIPGSVLNVHGLTVNGLGKDVWTVTFKQITDFVHVFYIMEILYFAEVAFLKLSILFFYLRIFPGEGIRRLIWLTIAFDTMFGTIFFILAIFQCKPISFYWKRWDGEHSGKCFDVNSMAFANAGISIALDVWMLSLAISQIIHINLHWKRKVGVGLMFGVGTFVTAVSIVRLQGLVTFANSINPTWDNWSTGIWSTVEINVGIICACMPSLRLLLVKLFPKLLATKNPLSSSDKSCSNDRRRHALRNMPGETGKPGILYSQSYNIEHANSWGDDKERLVQLNDVDTEFLSLRELGSQTWGIDHLYNSADAKSVASRLSSNFIPGP